MMLEPFERLAIALSRHLDASIRGVPYPTVQAFTRSRFEREETEPDALNAPLELHLPDGRVISGNGDAFYDDIFPDQYTVVWLEVPGWITPPPESLTVSPGADLIFQGIFLSE